MDIRNANFIIGSSGGTAGLFGSCAAGATYVVARPVWSPLRKQLSHSYIMTPSQWSASCWIISAVQPV